MGDMIEDYKEIKKVKKKEKVVRKDHSMELLKKHNIPFQLFNNGINELNRTIRTNLEDRVFNSLINEQKDHLRVVIRFTSTEVKYAK